MKMAATKAKMEIPNPRRILAVSLADSTHHLSQVIQDLTGSAPQPATDLVESTAFLAGTTHFLSLNTQYYTASVPVWLDVVVDPADWAESFLSAEAREVLAVLGGLVVVFGLPPPSTSSSSSSSTSASRKEVDIKEAREKTKELIGHVGKVVREGLGGWEWDGVTLGVGVGDLGGENDEHEEMMDEWEDYCAEAGLEFVHFSTGGGTSSAAGKDKTEKKEKNEFGETVGIQRVLEALQANDWSGGAEDDDEEVTTTKKLEGGDEFDPDSLDFGIDPEDFEGLKRAIIWGEGEAEDDGEERGESSAKKKPNDKAVPAVPAASGEQDGGGGREEEEQLDDEDVQKLQRMMQKLQAVRDLSAGLPEEQRKRIAKKAVTEVMKEL
ncbi:alpha and gamma adaptin binding protein p34-domain-containing protein [Podospora didyma]|uniref:Alpha and gamma adaptin binding protein p34-domain-containing protein n=1 Tax=Podospora didyma TaxID=330526 RepID=A0AAE0N4C7_9PEZI|nr:alpha and gamma adaptin binding protein p34-domain-containing protein [Podospora didyma]